MTPKSPDPPPYSLTKTIVGQIARVCELVGLMESGDAGKLDLRLRRVNQIRTIQGSLAIEGNTLTADQITAILNGKPVVAPPREVLEARNALNAYEQLDDWVPDKEADLLSAHRVLMQGLLEEAGHYRTGGVGVMSGDRVIHMAPKADRVRHLMQNLRGWLSGTDEHPLVSSSVFHYEFEFIHPFSDGNGRVGRLWQTLILRRWRQVLADVPVESLVHQNQADYYQAIQESTRRTDSAPFIEFMLEMIEKALSETTTPQVGPQVTPQVAELLGVLRGEMSRAQLQQALGLKDRKSFRDRYLVPALKAGVIEMTLPDKPTSRLQKYRRAQT